MYLPDKSSGERKAKETESHENPNAEQREQPIRNVVYPIETNHRFEDSRSELFFVALIVNQSARILRLVFGELCKLSGSRTPHVVDGPFLHKPCSLVLPKVETA